MTALGCRTKNQEMIKELGGNTIMDWEVACEGKRQEKKNTIKMQRANIYDDVDEEGQLRNKVVCV